MDTLTHLSMDLWETLGHKHLYGGILLSTLIFCVIIEYIHIWRVFVDS